MWEKRNRCKQSEAKPAAARSEPARNSEAHSSGDDRGGAGSWAGSAKKTCSDLFWFFSLSAELSHPAWLSSKAVGCCKRVARLGAGTQQALAGHSTALLPEGTCRRWGQGQLCLPLPSLSCAPQDWDLGHRDPAPLTACGRSLLAPTAARTALRAMASNACARSHPHGSAPIHQQVRQRWHVLLLPRLLTLCKLLPCSAPQFLLQCNERTGLCTSETDKALPWEGSALGTGTCLCASHAHCRQCRQECWHTGAMVATTLASPLARGACPLYALPPSVRTSSSLPPLSAAPPSSS